MAPAATKDTDEIKINRSEKRKKSDSSKTEQPKEKLIKKELIKKEQIKKEEEVKVDIYSEIHKLEDEESRQRPGENDLKLWKETCGELRDLMKDIFELKMKNVSQGEITEKKIQASLLFVTLKKLNRIEKLRLKSARDGTNMAKQSMDSFNLSLQNLLYEVLHLKKEVTKCVNFKSADDNLDLIPTETFYSEAPETVSNPDTTRSDPHAQRLARLQWELARRQDLNQDVEERETERDRVEIIIRSKEDKLRDLGPQLAGILEKTIPVQKYLELPLTSRRDQYELARLLPAPLYVMFSQCEAYSAACDPQLSVQVAGDQEEARRVQEETAEEEKEEEESQEAEQEEKTRRSKRKPGGEKAVRVHPLSVVMTVQLGGERSLELTCGWCLSLSLVTLELSVRQEAGGQVVTGEMMMEDSLLAHITPGDTGLQSPNPATQWTLANQGLNKNIQKLLPGKLFYLWAQRLAGLDYLETNKPDGGQVESKPEVSKLYMENIINAIKTRLEARFDLQQQLDKLKVKFDSSEVASQAALPVRTVAKLKSWQSIDWEFYSRQETTAHLTRSEIVHTDCYFYKATITRDKAVMTALVSISPSYPTVPPVFCLSLQNGDKTDTQESSEVIRDLEREINVEVGDTATPGLLSIMIHRLLLLTDIVLEVDTSLGRTDGEFCKSQVFLDNVRGRMRRLPLHYNSVQQMFQQR